MKLSSQQIEDSFETVNEDDWKAEFEELEDLPPMDRDIDESVYLSSVSRKELRSKAVRDRDGVVGHGNYKRRKY